MANALFDKARQRFLEGQFNWNTDTIKAVLVDTGTYTVNLSAHEFLSDIGTGARIATSGAFTGKTTTGGAADANDVTFTSVTGASIEAIVLYKDTGTYTVNLSAHEFLSDIGTGARIATSGAFTGKATVGGAADANDVTFTSVTGASIEAIVLYKDTGTDSTSPLIAFIDTATGLPITPNGGDIIVTWDNGANKIFKL